MRAIASILATLGNRSHEQHNPEGVVLGLTSSERSLEPPLRGYLLLPFFILSQGCTTLAGARIAPPWA